MARAAFSCPGRHRTGDDICSAGVGGRLARPSSSSSRSRCRSCMTTSPASSTATTSPARPRDHCQLHSHVPAGRPASSARAARDALPRPFDPFEAPALAFQFQSQELTAVAVRSRAVASSPCHVHVHSQITRPAGPGRSRSGPATVTMSAVSTESVVTATAVLPSAFASLCWRPGPRSRDLRPESRRTCCVRRPAERSRPRRRNHPRRRRPTRR